MTDLTIVHSSDLHIDVGAATDAFHPLCRVLAAARRAQAQLLLLAGDIFDNNRLPLSLLDSSARLLADAGMPVVILPGNHDCLTADSVYRRGGISDVPNVHVIGVSTAESCLFPELDLEIWGRAHTDYANMSPLERPPARTTRWQIGVAHGHWLRSAADQHRGWLFSDEEIAATGADYLALGHWPQAIAAGDGRVPAYYSGSPDLAGTVNLVRLSDGGRPDVRRLRLTR